MGRLNLLRGQSILGGQIPTKFTCYLPPWGVGVWGVCLCVWLCVCLSVLSQKLVLRMNFKKCLSPVLNCNV